jgi:protein gp37
VENQEMADKRIPALLKIPAKVRFLSCEPLLAPVDLLHIRAPFRDTIGDELYFKDLIHWVICGGESGAHARPMLPAWARSLRDQCGVARVPFHFKQWGEFGPVQTGPNSETMVRSGVRVTGRMLDGILHDAFPF